MKVNIRLFAEYTPERDCLYVFRLAMEAGEEALSLETVVIVACVCGSIVLVLTVVLIVLCCRRHRIKCQYSSSSCTDRTD